jgi:hypothetical protein
MMESRKELLALLAELSDADADLRLGQLIANVATLAHGATAAAIWDSEDDELVAAARRLLAHYRARQADVA